MLECWGRDLWLGLSGCRSCWLVGGCFVEFCSLVGPWFGGRLVGVELRWLVAEVFERCCGGSSGDLG